METPTHVTTQQNKKPATPLDKIRVALTEQGMLNKVINYYGGDKDAGVAFMTSVIDYIRRVPKLLDCTHESLAIAFAQSAQYHFMPSSVGGEAYVIPYKNEAKFQIGYQGLVTLIYRTRKVLSIDSNIVYENDVFEYQEGLNASLIHKPSFGREKGKPIGVYTVAHLEGGVKTFKVMDEAAIMKIKGLSKAKASPESPWNSNLDPELWMWRKTCLIQHIKTLPKSIELQAAIEKDYEGEGIDKPVLDPIGVATARASHEPEKPVTATAPKVVKNEAETPPAPDESVMEDIIERD